MSPKKDSHKALNISLWMVQVLLAVAFGMAGSTKIVMPMEELVRNMVWPGDVPELLVRFIGLCEVAGALGMILPSVSRIQPRLTSFAGCGLAAVMVLASLFHMTRGEWQMLPVNLILASLAVFVAWGRFRKVPIKPR